MAKKTSKAAAAAALQITADCDRDAQGYGALPFVKCDRKPPASIVDRADIAALKATLLAAGFESNEVSLQEAMKAGDVPLEVEGAWDESANVADWMPHKSGPFADGHWMLVAVLYSQSAPGADDEDAVAILARPAGLVDQPPAADVSEPPIELRDEAVPPAPAMTKSEAHLGRKAAQFELPEPIKVLLKSFTPRVEKHGDDDVSASSFGFVITAPNTILDRLSSALRHIFYAAPDGQVTLPGVEESTPLLRTKLIESVKLSNVYEGWTMRVYAGMDDDDPFVIGGCKVDKFALELIDGGSTKMAFRVGSSDLDEHEAGWFYGHLGQTIVITLHAPLAKPDAIDGSQGHPGLGAADPDDGPDATDLFAAQHGDGAGDDTTGERVDEDGEGEHEAAEEGAAS